MQQVARRAGVSTSTVSRTFANPASVAAATVGAVRLAAREIGFSPRTRRASRSARPITAVASGQMIALLAFGERGVAATPLFERLLRAVSVAADEHDLTLSLHFVADPATASRRLANLPPAGVLAFGDPPAEPLAPRLRSLPTVWLMAGRRRAPWGDQVMPNDAAIGDIACRHLVRRGHRRLAYVMTNADAWSTGLRAFAFRKAAEEIAAEAAILDAQQFRRAALPAGVAPTGILVDDAQAVATIRAAIRRGDVPREPEFICYDDRGSRRADLTPEFAWIDVRPELLGRLAVEQLVGRVRHAGAAERVRTLVEPTLFIPARPSDESNHAEDDESRLPAQSHRSQPFTLGA